MTEQVREPQVLPSERRPLGVVTPGRLAEILDQHRQWLESEGRVGKRADLSRLCLQEADLTGADLQRAFFRKADLREADLSLTNLQNGCLIRANLQGACLLGTNLREANLEGAMLEDAAGLSIGQVAGANLAGAVLPNPVIELEGLKFVEAPSRIARRLFVTMLAVSAAAWLLIANTTDVQLLTNSAPLPLPYVGSAIPMAGFYLLAPFILLGLYISFHFYLGRMWERLGELPAVFSDGQALDRKVTPWLLVSLIRDHSEWLGKNRPPLFALEKWLAVLLGYWVVPATLLLFWGRYLTRQDLHDSILHLVVVAAAIALGLSFQDLLRQTLRPEPVPSRPSKKGAGNLQSFTRGAFPLGIGLLLFILSFGIIYGVPHDGNRASALEADDVRRWPAHALWAVGYDPYSDLTQLDVSTKPATWTDKDNDLALVEGAQLNKASLRYAEAHRVFLANASLWKADLQGAYLSEADLRGADLEQANLQSALLDRANLARAKLQQAHLQRANLSRADLRHADFSFADLSASLLVDAAMENANLYEANLRSAWLSQATLRKADLRRTNLEDAKLVFADLRGAYLQFARLVGAGLQNAQLQHGFFTEATLKDADLRGADLQGSIFHGAHLNGANLEGADFRGVVGLTAAQICSAKKRQGVELDEELQQQVIRQCGTDESGSQPTSPRLQR